MGLQPRYMRKLRELYKEIGQGWGYAMHRYPNGVARSQIMVYLLSHGIIRLQHTQSRDVQITERGLDLLRVTPWYSKLEDKAIPKNLPSPSYDDDEDEDYPQINREGTATTVTLEDGRSVTRYHVEDPDAMLAWAERGII